MPLSFIASLYGMNFVYLPEKDWEYGYPAVLTLMACVALFMYFFFKKRKWFQ
jgi:magnesium transporter